MRQCSAACQWRKCEMEMPHDIVWRDDIDAIQFRFDGSDRLCFIHRLAFKTLLTVPPDADRCLAFFLDHREVFLSAAVKKAARTGQPDQNIHITSRDVARMLVTVKALIR